MKVSQGFLLPPTGFTEKEAELQSRVSIEKAERRIQKGGRNKK